MLKCWKRLFWFWITNSVRSTLLSGQNTQHYQDQFALKICQRDQESQRVRTTHCLKQHQINTKSNLFFQCGKKQAPRSCSFSCVCLSNYLLIFVNVESPCNSQEWNLIHFHDIILFLFFSGKRILLLYLSSSCGVSTDILLYRLYKRLRWSTPPWVINFHTMGIVSGPRVPRVPI